ncbi:VOC family protein [Alistipes communis]|uniref:VOC family protein n=1 Tax=Alistipes communis TaxID=2585118 RepID=UPI00307AFDA1
MRLHHLALWSRRIELLRDFYTTYFDGRAGEKYENPAKGFESYFVTFADGVSLELMRRTDVTAPDAAQHLGLAHFAFVCESRAEVDRLTERLRADGHPVLSEPRTTGDGYYESAVGDPDGNLVELVYKA